MNTLLVTSRVTFIPNNYNDFICSLASCRHISGLIILDNLDRSIFFSAAKAYFAGARRIARNLVINTLPKHHQARFSAFNRFQKPVYLLKSINSEEAKNIIADNQTDLIVNARTRSIYRKDLLSMPKMGCINIHHGLLPNQRGTMCDLWAMAENRKGGFSIHTMNEKIDDGDILGVYEVPQPESKDYCDYLTTSGRLEYQAIVKILDELEKSGSIEGCANRSDGSAHYRNPNYNQIRAFLKRGYHL